MKLTDMLRYHVIEFCQNYANGCRNFKEVGILMQWPRLILPVKNQVVEFIARWRHLLHQFVQYRFNRCVQNNSV